MDVALLTKPLESDPKTVVAACYACRTWAVRAHALPPPHSLKTVDKNGNLNSAAGIASLIDHTLLKPEATAADIERLCEEALECNFISVCVNPFWVAFASGELEGSKVKVCATVGFPLGANRTNIKLAEASAAIADGATEIDMVINVGALRSGDWELVEGEVSQLALLVHHSNALLKVILETCLLTDAEKIIASKLAAEAGADFVKTSTGFSRGGATIEDVKLMRDAVGQRCGVKASGGIRNLASLREMVAAGANRIGTSAGVQIIAEFNHG